MTRAKISEYSATANDNTDVNGIDIAEGCPPSSMNNMGREIMAALKRFQVGSDGDGVTVGGSLVVSGSTTANTLTATVLNATTIDTTNIEVTNIKAKDGTASVSIADTTGIPTISKATVISTTDNTNAALRITQLGTGNALLVEDSTNPDATPFVISNNGSVIVGKDSALTSYKVEIITLGEPLSTAKFANSSSASSHLFAKSRSTTPGTYSILSSGDGIASLNFAGDDGTAFITAAQITAAVDGTPGTGDMPGRLVFSTTADGASSPTERMRIGSTGAVGIGSSLTGGGGSGCTLRFANNITGGTTSVSILGTPQVQSDVTLSAQIFTSAPSTQATSFTLTNLNHFRANQGTLGAGSAVTNQYGFEANSTLTGATNNYGFYSNIASGTGRWNFYANGTADNYFAGQVQLGAGTVSAPALSTTGDTNTGIYFPAADNIGFATNGVIRGRWTTDGLCFGSDTAAANALDDYEEGTWTPAIIGTGGSIGAQAYATQVGRYIKIGRFVLLTGYVVLTDKGSWSGNAKISGFPFTVTNEGASYSASNFYYANTTLPANNFSLGAFVDIADTKAQLFSSNNTGTSNTNYSTIGNTSQIGPWQICYFTSS